MNNDDERDFAEESANRAMMEQEAQEEANWELHDQYLFEVKHQQNPPTFDEWREEIESDGFRRNTQRWFIGQSGWVWVVWHIIEMEDSWDNPDVYKVRDMLPASDGTIIFPGISLFQTKAEAMSLIESNYTHRELFRKTTITEL